MKVLVTGAAGFIGMHTALRLLARGDTVIGVDNLNDYYDVDLKRARLAQLTHYPNFHFHKIDLAERDATAALFANEQPERVIHLAAQPGVRYSLENPHAYIDSNIVGFTNVLEGCRHNKVQHLVYASSSSVYGGNTNLPFSEHDNVDHPVSLYAATKKANELMAHTYSHLYDLPTTGLRFFTVYGPWGRPDMAPFLFVDAMLSGQPINLFNHGDMVRDFTYIDDAVESVVRVCDKVAMSPSPSVGSLPYRIFNIGNNQPMPLTHFVAAIEQALGVEAKKVFLPMQPGDVYSTAANTEELKAWVGFQSCTSLQQGVSDFIDWYRQYYDQQPYKSL